ncbi:TPA: restriction endonuclease subunit S [Vibrio vulnificus]
MVPNGWELSTFEKHVDLLSGFAFKSAHYTEDDNDIKLLRGDNIAPNTLRWSGVKTWDRTEYCKLEKYHLVEHDFVIAMDRTWVSSGLKVAEVKKEDLPCLLVQRVSRIRTLPTLEQSLLKQYFSSHRFEQYVKGVQTETAVPHISAKQIKEFTFLLPPLPEQRKIAKILSTWDKAITTTEKLIETSKQQKKALMQQLLTGKKRLVNQETSRAFEGEWEEVKLGELGQTFTGLTGKTKEDFGSGSLYIPYINIFNNSSVNMAKLEKVHIGYGEKQNTVQFGDVFFTTSSETPDEVGMSSVMLSESEESVYLNSFCFGFRPNDTIRVVPEFMQYLLRSNRVRRSISVLAQGATRYNLSKVQLLKISLFLPTYEEQQKIASVLTAADKDIEVLEAKLSHLKQEKKALMQQLLTGKRRVQVEESVAA